MAEDSTDYIHPVIQAIQFAKQRLDAKNELAQKQKNAETDQQFREKQLAQALKEHQDEIGQKQQELDLQSQIAKTQLQQHDLEIQKFIKDFLESGGKPTQTPQSQNFIPTITNPTPPSQFSVGGIPVSPEQMQQYNPQNALNRQLQNVSQVNKAAATGTQAGIEPFKISEENRGMEREKEKLKLEEEAKTRLANLDNASRERIATLNNDTRGQVALINAQTRLAAAQNGFDPGDSTNLINDIYVTGNQGITNIPSKHREAIVKSVPQGWTPVDPKDKPILDGVGMVQDLIGKSKQLAEEGSGVQGRIAAATGLGFLGEAGNTVKQLDGLMGNISRIFGGERGVLTQRDIERAKGLLYSATSTDKQNQDNNKELQKFFKDKLKPVLSKYAPDQLEKILGARGIDPTVVNGPKVPDSLDYRKKYQY